MSVVAVEAYLQTSEYGIVAAAALLVFDYCLTLGQEVEWLYGTKWTIARIHFTSSRYLPFVAIATSIPASRVQSSMASYCGQLGTAADALYYLCIVIAEVMLIVRTYAFWRRNKKILIGMCTFGVACMILAIVPSETITSKITNSIYKALSCTGVESTVATAIQYMCLVLYEMGMLGLNWIAFRRIVRQNPPSRLILALYRNSMAYMAAILMFSVVNAIVTLAAPIQYSDILNSPQMVMHSILASRIFFNLRETTRQQRNTSLSITLTEFVAAPSDFTSSLGSSSSGSRRDPARTIDTTRIIDITRGGALLG